MKKQHDVFIKKVLRQSYRMYLGIKNIIDYSIPKTSGINVNYGGAQAGDLGGPLVKVKRLQEYFPEKKWGYNIAYLLSNTPYLFPSTLNLMKKKGIRMVHNQNGVFYPAWYEGDWQRQNEVMAHSYHIADYVFWQSEFCRRTANMFLGKRKGPGEVLYNAVNTEKFSPELYKDFSREFTFLITGKISRHLAYRVMGCIEALSMVRKMGLKAQLVVAGWLDEKVLIECKLLTEKFKIENGVKFLGSYSQEFAPDIYRNADVYLMTKHNDPCPNTVLEAMACGLPVIYSDSGGVPELVGKEAGLPVPCDENYEKTEEVDVVQLSNAMLAISKKHPSMALKARQRAIKNLEINNWINRHKEIFTELLDYKI